LTQPAPYRRQAGLRVFIRSRAAATSECPIRSEPDHFPITRFLSTRIVGSRLKGSGAARHYVWVTVILHIPLLLAALAGPDEAADRAAIGRTIAALNEVPQRTTLFAPGADATSEIERLWKGKRLVYRISGTSIDSTTSFSGGRPTITISHEPWGEAAINLPPLRAEMIRPHIVSGTIRFIAEDVAVADGPGRYELDGVSQTTPLFFVMKRDGDDWKIAAVRVLAAASATDMRPQ